jgi:hypothetical protein
MRTSFNEHCEYGRRLQFFFSAECCLKTFGFFSASGAVPPSQAMRRMLRPAPGLLAILLLAFSPFPGRAGTEDVSVVRSDGRSIVLEYHPRFLPDRIVTEGSTAFRIIDFDGAIPSITGENPGNPDLRYRRIPLGFPSAEDHSVQVIAADFEDIAGVRLAPVPALRIRDEMVEPEAYRPRPDAYDVNAFLPPSLVELGPIRQVRSILVGGVRIFPVQFNPVTGVLRKYSRIVVEVVYGPVRGVPARNEDDRTLAAEILNADVTRDWRFPPSPPARVPPSVLAQGQWFRLTVAEEGVYRLDPQYFSGLGIDPASVDPRTIKIYGNGGAMVPENVTAPRPSDLQENAILVAGEEDGQFGAGDAVLFYGRGAKGWTYVPSERRFQHYINYYSDVNYYWLTFGGAPGKRMVQVASLQDAPTVIPDWFQDCVFVDEDKVNLLSSGKEWLGQTLSPGGSFTHVFSVPGLVAGQSVRYRSRLLARSNVWSTIALKETGVQIGSVNLPPVGFSSGDFIYATEGAVDVQVVPPIAGTTSQLNFSLAPASAIGNGWIDWVEIQYPRRFESVNNTLRFRSPDTTGVVEYRLTQFSSRPTILDVSTPADARLVTGDVGSYTIRMAETGGRVSEYCAAAPGGYRLPLGAVRMPLQNIRGITEGAEFIILTTAEFRAEAERLAAHRRQGQFGGLRTFVVEVDSVYNEFAGGIPDITGIRDFLKYAYDTWTIRPEYALMLGGASYDYKGISGSRSSYVPTWQSQESRNDIASYSTDDFFVKFQPGDLPWLATGRICSRSRAEAATVIGKVIAYDTRRARDGWNTRMLFVGDDSWTPEREDGTLHSNDAELLATSYTPDEFEKRKIYIAEYPTVNTAQGRRKPGAYQAIIDEVNRGVLVVNYAGHGNPTVWAHESIFSVQTSIPQLVNGDKLSVFYAATCNFSQFDDLRRYTGSELLMNSVEGGAIAVVSATRKVFAGANAYFHQGIFRNMFGRDTFGRLLIDRPARAMLLQKRTGNSINDQKFCFLGDPTMRLGFPPGYASIDSINAEPVDSVGGGVRTVPIRLKALSRVTLGGTIRDQQDAVDVSASGTVALTLADATRLVTITAFIPERCCDSNGNIIPAVDWPYRAAGGVVYRGQSSVANGRFTASFIVPKDILYADSTTRGRLVARFTGPATEGLGFTSNVSVGGTDSTAPADGRGPDMQVYLDSRSFRPGDVVGENPQLIVDLTDSSGINTSISGIGHRIEAWVNTASSGQDVTEFYTARLDNFQEGTVQTILKGMTSGRNTVRVRAWDTYNNASTAETYFDVASTEQLRISDVFNYPNPFASGTEFTFRQNLLSPLNVTVKIYTLAGRVIQTLEMAAAGDPFVRIPWDGRDRDGDVLANGAYLYKMIVKTADGQFTSEVLGRMAVLK